jgi:hypothetical protein
MAPCPRKNWRRKLAGGTIGKLTGGGPVPVHCRTEQQIIVRENSMSFPLFWKVQRESEPGRKSEPGLPVA